MPIDALFLEWLSVACDRPAQLKTQSAQREDVFFLRYTSTGRQLFVNRAAAPMTAVDQSVLQIGFHG